LANPWTKATLQDAKNFDKQKQISPYKERMAIKNEILWGTLQKYLPQDKSGTVLDLGGGTGIWSMRLAKEGYSLILTDISEAVLEWAKEKIDNEKLSEKVIVEPADICDLSKYKDNSFSFVMAIGDILSYCSDAEKGLKEIKRVLKPQGLLIGDVENRYKIFDGRRATSWEDAIRILNGGVAYWPDKESPAPIHQFTPTEIEDLLSAHKFQTIEMYPSHLMWGLFNEEFLQQAINSKGGLQEIVNIEKKMSKDKHLLGCGFEIQFIVRNEK